MGVEVEVTKEAEGPKPRSGQTVTVHCTGYVFDTKKKFWSTKDPGQKVFSFKIGQGQVIKGWDEGVAQMNVGSHATLVATADYAYGPGGFPAWGIPPNATLQFDIELLAAE